MTLLAANYFKDRSKAEGIVAIVENRSYAIDAIQVINSCTCEEKILILKIFGACLHISQTRR
jgi:formylmethanofuran dehydrogenase subunit E